MDTTNMIVAGEAEVNFQKETINPLIKKTFYLAINALDIHHFSK